MNKISALLLLFCAFPFSAKAGNKSWIIRESAYYGQLSKAQADYTAKVRKSPGLSEEDRQKLKSESFAAASTSLEKESKDLNFRMRGEGLKAKRTPELDPGLAGQIEGLKDDEDKQKAKALLASIERVKALDPNKKDAVEEKRPSALGRTAKEKGESRKETAIESKGRGSSSGGTSNRVLSTSGDGNVEVGGAKRVSFKKVSRGVSSDGESSSAGAKTVTFSTPSKASESEAKADDAGAAAVTSFSKDTGDGDE